MALRRSARNERVNVEYVSANPTGPMHMGHCRGAVVGDALARLLEAAGFRVTKEYYVNDAGGAGRHARPLGRTCATARRSARTSARFPKACIRATIWFRSASLLAAEYGDDMSTTPEERMAADLFREWTVAAMLDLIRHDLALLGIHHDKFASEAELQKAGRGRAGDGESARRRAWSTKARSSGPKASTSMTSGSRSS